jgi:hypothetical protein
MKQLVLVMTAAGFLGLAGSVVAGDAPIRLTDTQMDDVVAGALVSETTTYTYFHGYSNNPANGPGPGVSTYETTTQVWCPGASVTCAAPAQTTVVGEPTLVSGPGM